MNSVNRLALVAVGGSVRGFGRAAVHQPHSFASLLTRNFLVRVRVRGVAGWLCHAGPSISVSHYPSRADFFKTLQNHFKCC
jgi:hypothetical protein